MNWHLLLGAGSLVLTSSYVVLEKVVFVDDEQASSKLSKPLKERVLSKLDIGIETRAEEVPVVPLRDLNLAEMAAAYDRGEDPAELIVSTEGAIVKRPSGISKALEQRLFHLIEGSFARIFGRLNLPSGHKSVMDWSKWWAQVQVNEADFIELSKAIKSEMEVSNREFDGILNDHGDEVQEVLKSQLTFVARGGRGAIENPKVYGQAVDLIWEQLPSPVRMVGRERIGYDAYMERVRQEMLKGEVY